LKPIQKIMVAVDLSDYSLPSLCYAVMLAKTLGAEIILANVYNRRDVNAVRNALEVYYEPKFFDQIVEENFAFRRGELAQMVEKAQGRDVVTKQIIKIGVPHEELLAVIEEEKPDMLVMVTKGRGNLADTIVGSCAAKMYRRSPIPVLSLRPGIKDELQ